MASVSIAELSVTLSTVFQISNLSLDIQDGEFFALIGPSGCGKTTILRAIAGLIKPSSGRIYFNKIDITELPPHKRNAPMVFQSYALWPHMTVFENVAFGLRARGVTEDEIRDRVDATTKTVQIEKFLDRYPHQLSGGQQQRVALARALVVNPAVILLDEPLSNLDAKLRVEVRSELRELHSKTKTTMVYVTHDQADAIVLANRIAIMRNGAIEQIAPPAQIYSDPKNSFVAAFIGDAAIIPVEAIDQNGVARTSLGAISTRSGSDTATPANFLAIRPENVQLLSPGESKPNTFSGTLTGREFLGGFEKLTLRCAGDILIPAIAPGSTTKIGDSVTFFLPPDKITLLER